MRPLPVSGTAVGRVRRKWLSLVEDPWGNQRAGFAVRGSIDRTDFGLTWQSRLAGGGLLVGEEVGLLLDLSAVAS